ncbi:hypothetical protein [Polaromonas aquatica]|uniref:hypothetical protein n=1 Tax=Polaromonas aquatica TaxID=332657 RepID=UPI003D654F5B
MSTSPSNPLSRLLHDCHAWDKSRDSFPGEHWLVFGAGVALLLASGRSSSPLKRALGSMAGSALLYRAASGRDGVAKLVAYLPAAKGLLRIGR